MAKLAKMVNYLFLGRLLMYISSMRRKKLHRNIPELPFSLKQIRGAIGKEYVIKDYSYGAIRTKYPDMTKIIASTKQRKCRTLFSEGVEYARAIMKDPVQKERWLKKVRQKHRLFKYLVGKGMAIAKAEAAERQQTGAPIIWDCFVQGNEIAGLRTERFPGPAIQTCEAHSMDGVFNIEIIGVIQNKNG